MSNLFHNHLVFSYPFILCEFSSCDLSEEDGYYEDLYPDPVDLKSDDSSVDLSMASSESEVGNLSSSF